MTQSSHGSLRQRPAVLAGSVLLMDDRLMMRTVGVVSGLAGLGLTTLPVESGRALGLHHPPLLLRALGVIDLAVGAALVRPGAGWQPLAWRSALNLGLCAMYIASASEPSPRPVRSRMGLSAMGAVTVFDGALMAHRRKQLT